MAVRPHRYLLQLIQVTDKFIDLTFISNAMSQALQSWRVFILFNIYYLKKTPCEYHSVQQYCDIF